jgi:UDP-glucose 4-epimerase
MKILVTGGAGFVGTNLIKRLLKDGHEVVSVDNYSAGFIENHQEGCLYHDYDLSSQHTLGIYVDHGSYPSWREVEYDVIFHMAALARIQPSLKNPYKTLFNNFVSTLNILELARRNSTRFVYAGSSSLHHGLYGSPYAWSKFSGEELCKLYSSVYDVETSICRFYNVYGDYQIKEGTYATVLGIFQNQYENKEPLTIVGDGEQRRDFTHVDDIVDGIVRASEEYFKECEIFELGRGVNFSINEIVDMFGKDCPREYIEQRPGEYDVTLADYSHAQDLLNWKPTRNIEDYIKKIK